MIKFHRTPNYIRERYISWKGENTYGRASWIERAKKSEGYYYNDMDGTGTTYTSSQYSKIKEITGLPVSINFLHPVTNQKLAILVQTKPSMRTISTDGRARTHAQILDKMKHAVLYMSGAQNEIENMVKDMLISGMGGIMSLPTTFYRSGAFKTAIAHIPYDEFILDVNAKKRNLEDMEGFFIEKAFTVPKTMQLFGDIISQLKDEMGNPVSVNSLLDEVWVESVLTREQDVVTPQYNQQGRIIVREFYEKIYTTMYTVPDPESGVYSFMFSENIEDQSILATSVNQSEDIYIKRTIIMGDFVVFEEILPISQYPLKVSFFEWGGKPYRSYGMIHFTKSMQEAFDKIIQIMIVNGMLSNNAGWKAPKGAIMENDRSKWEDYANNPRALREYNPIVKEGKVLVPEKEQVQQLSNFYPMVLEMLKSGIEYSTGISAILQGNAQEAGVEVFSSLQQYQNAAMMRIILSTSHINQTLSELGQVLTEYLTANITPDTYQFFDDKGDLNELAIAQEIANDIKLYRYLVVSVPDTAMPTQRLAVSTELMKIAQSSPDPIERSLYTQTAMDLTEIRGFEDLREKLDVVRNTQAKLEDLQKAFDRLSETSKQMENKYINISLENRILKELAGKETKIAEAFAKMEAKVGMAEELLKAKEKEKTQTK